MGHNYLRSATHAAANTRLVDYHTPLPASIAVRFAVIPAGPALAS